MADMTEEKKESALVTIGRLIDEHHATFENAEDEPLKQFWTQLKAAVDQESAFILKTIEELRGLHFFVDRYQRGYKWEPQQVEALLKDIAEFEPQGDSFYCLQPVVVKHHPPTDEVKTWTWELIDGQQRMTTVYMILHYLKGGAHCKLDYRTREESRVFLKEHLGLIEEGQCWSDFVDVHPKYDNIDIYHFFEAYRAIQDWFNGRSNDKRENWEKKLLQSTQVIWYTAKEHESEDSTKASIEIFMRLNSGKIPLTQAELIKALMLHYAAPADDRMRAFRQDTMVREWDQMEHALQDDAFYYFLYPVAAKRKSSEDGSTRIDLIFNLLLGSSPRDPLYAFNELYKELNSVARELRSAYIEKKWSEVRHYYYRFCEWYEDDEFYHLIGLLLSWNVSIDDLRKGSQDKSRSQFTEGLHQRITIQLKKDLRDDDDKDRYSLDKLAYKENNGAIHHVLLLFNIQSHLDQHTRFPFKNYHQQSWSLEHIHAQNSKDLPDREFLERYLSEQAELIRDLDFPEEQRTNLSSALEHWRKNPEKAEPERAYHNIADELFQMIADDEMDGISNLALLSCEDNSSLNDSDFASKRELIRELEATGVRYVPLTTLRVFSKYYSASVLQLNRWEPTDRKQYREALLTCVQKYFEGVK